MLFVNGHVLNYITLNSIFTFNEIRVKYHESLMIKFLTREIKNGDKFLGISGNCAREQFIANQVKTGITGKRKGNSGVETRPSQLPRTITFPYALVPCIVSHVEPATKWWKTVRA